MYDNIFVKGKTKIYHANLLKLFHERAENTADITLQLDVAVIDPELNIDEERMLDDEDLLELRLRTNRKTHKDVNINKDLSAKQRKEVQELLQEFEDVFRGILGTTHLEEHKIETIMNEPVRVKQHQMLYAMQPANYF